MNDQIEGMFTSITASMVDLIVIVILDVIFLFLAKESSEMNHSLWIIFYYSAVRTRESYNLFTERKKWFTDLEVPRTQQEYDDSYSIKVCSLSYWSTMELRWRQNDVKITSSLRNNSGFCIQIL